MTRAPADPRVLAALEAAGALLVGHFQLSSGLHADRYVEKFNLLQWPDRTAEVCASLADGARDLRPATVVGPTTGGVIVAYEVARQLGVRAVIAERNPDGPGRLIQRDFRLEPGERVLVVDDVMTSGGSVRDSIEAVRIAGGDPVAAAVLVDRSSGLDLGVPFSAATGIDLQTYEPGGCPLCSDGVPLTVT